MASGKSTPKSTDRSPDKPDRRQKILGAAEQLFQHYGFAKTTVSDIARAARVGVGTVYLEFPSKEHIASELSLHRYDRMLDAMRTAAAGPGTYAERLPALLLSQLDCFWRFAHAGPHGKELIHGACMATDQAHERFRDAQYALLTEFLQAATDDGEFDIDNPPRAARVLLRLCASFTVKPASDPLETRAEATTAFHMLLHGLIARAESP